MNTRRITERLPWMAIIMGAVALLINDMEMPLVGDDFRYAIYYPSRQDLIHTMGGIYLHCNARFGDLTNYIWLTISPRILTSAICAGMFILMYMALFRLSGLHASRPLSRSLLILLSCVVLPLGDCLYLFVVQFNYLWAMAISGMTLWLIISRDMHSHWWIMFAPVAAIAGFTHEIVGIPLLLGTLAWLRYVNRRQLTLPKKLVLAALFTGCLISISSPGSYTRLHSNTSAGYPEIDTIILNAVKSGYIAVILIADTLLILALRRATLRSLCRSSWLPLAIISVTSLTFAAIAGVHGRSGWATQFFGLAALARQYTMTCKLQSIPQAWSTAAVTMLSLALTFMWGAVIYWQDIVNREMQECVDAYESAPGSVITIQYHDKASIPWYVRPVISIPLEEPWNMNAITTGSNPSTIITRAVSATSD